MDTASGTAGPVAPGRGPVCDPCARSPAFDAFVRLGRYDSPLGRLARQVKRRAWHRAAALLGDRLAMEVRDRLRPPSDGWCVVPVPATLLRRLARGIDHTYALALAMSSALDAPLVLALAVGTASRQAGLDRTQRLARRSSMRTRRRACRVIRGRSVLLVDDVRTTGSTLIKARELLEEAGVASVVPVVICVAERRKRMRGMNLQDRPISASGPECRKLVHIQNPLKEGC